MSLEWPGEEEEFGRAFRLLGGVERDVRILKIRRMGYLYSEVNLVTSGLKRKDCDERMT